MDGYKILFVVGCMGAFTARNVAWVELATISPAIVLVLVLMFRRRRE